MALRHRSPPATGERPAPGACAGPLGSAYWRVWAASVISAVGDGVRLVAMPLLAAGITRDPLAVSLVTVATSLPWLLCSLLSGALVDRFDRRLLLWTGNAFQAVAMGAFTVTVLAGWRSIAMLVVFALLVGAAQTLVDLAAQAILPAVVRRAQLGRANGRLQAGLRVTGMLVGPPLGGVLYAVGPPVPFLVDALSFAASGALVVTLRGRFREAAGDGGGNGTGVTARIREGMRWLGRHRLLRALCAALTVWSLVDTAVLAVLPLYALDCLGLPDAQIGALLSAGAVGGIAGSLLAARIAARVGETTASCATLLTVGLAYGGLAATSTVAVAAAMLLLMGIASGAWVVVVTSVRQAVIPDGLLGRVSSAYRFVGFGTRPLGAALGGYAARDFGLHVPFAGASVVMAATTAVALAVLPAAARRHP
jgi:MFS family permease